MIFFNKKKKKFYNLIEFRVKDMYYNKSGFIANINRHINCITIANEAPQYTYHLEHVLFF